MAVTRFKAGSDRSGIQMKINNDWDTTETNTEVVDNALTSAISEDFDNTVIRLYEKMVT